MSNILIIDNSNLSQTVANNRYNEIISNANLAQTTYGSKVKTRLDYLFNNSSKTINGTSIISSILSTELVVAAINNTAYDQSGTKFSKLSPNINDLTIEGSLSIGYSGTDLITKLQSSTDGTTGGKLQVFTKEDGGSLTEKIIITSSGNLGVGTTTPSEKLSIDGGNLRIKNDYNDNLRQSNIILEEADGDGNVVIQYNGFSTIDNSKVLSIGSQYTGWTALGSGLNYLPSNGNVGIGNYPSEKLEVSGNIKASGVIYAETTALIGGNHKNYGTGNAFFAHATRYDAANHSHALFTNSSGLTSLNSSGGNDVVITHENVYNHRFKSDGNVYHKKKVGINNVNPTVSLHIIQEAVDDLLDDVYDGQDLDNDDASSIRIQYGSNFWDFAFANNDKNLHFLYNKINRGWLNDTFAAGQIDFTGQHRSSSNIDFTDNEVGLIVSSTGTYNNLSGTNLPTIDEAIPIVELSAVQNDKKVFGVISNNEGKTREYHQGIFVSVISKNVDDNRLIINSLGEGAIWVCNINGNLENGDYITSSGIGGYGMKQDDDLLHNYTVAKITCDCDFNNVNDSNDSTLLRYLDTSGNITTSDEYSINGGYVAIFVGCTYHCG